MENVVYGLFCALAVGGALGVIIGKSYINAVMSMLSSMVGMAGLLFMMEAFLLAFVMLLVYAGAVMVLFVFTVMLAGGERENSGARRRICAAGLWILMSAAAAYFALNCPQLGAAIEDGIGDLAVSKYYGVWLFTKYILLFEIAGAVLLAAMAGIIAVAKDPNPERPKREML
ncbi:MAG: NADH-quinone oxidoreductase subunit J [Opitutales bacterium]|nr:NADH-quinone oxidoreductase subunit J [Opitutales bacterium]